MLRGIQFGFRLLVIATAALVLGGCGGGGGGGTGGSGSTGGGGGGTTPTPTVTLTSIAITPSTTQSLVVGTTLQFTATGYYSNNTSAPLTSVYWNSTAPGIASISGSGQALGLAAGSTTIYAALNGVVSPSVTINVTNATPTSMTITPASATIGIGQPITLAASAVFNNGTTGDVTAVSTWTVSNSSAQLGWPYGWPNFNVVNGMSAGSVVVTATYGGVSASANITVAPSYAVGGRLLGLPATASVSLQNNGTDNITVTDSTITYSYGNSTTPGFVFNNTLAPGALYNITISSQPATGHPCTVVDGSGAVNSTTPQPVTWAQVVCAPAVGTVAGNIVNGVANTMGGYADSTIGTNAMFYVPAGVVLDSLHAGNIYVADSQNNAIRLITPSGAVSTLAGGSSTYSYVNGTGTSARFSRPRGLVEDAAGNLYVADNWNNVIRMVTQAGVVSTFAGQTPATTGGAAAPAGYVNSTTLTGAQFNNPDALARDGNGNIYVADTANNVIRMINTSGVVSTLSGATPAMTGGAPAPAGYVNSTTSTAAQFNQPDGLAVDPTNTYLYVVEWNNCAIRQVTIATGAVATLAGAAPGAATLCGYADGAVGSALFFGMNGVAVDSLGNVYLADTKNDLIRMITPGAGGSLSSGTVSTIVGTGSTIAPPSGFADGLAPQALLNYPQFLAVDSAGNVIISDSFNNLIRKYTP